MNRRPDSGQPRNVLHNEVTPTSSSSKNSGPPESPKHVPPFFASPDSVIERVSTTSRVRVWRQSHPVAAVLGGVADAVQEHD